jgi:serine/threonine protein kinase
MQAVVPGAVLADRYVLSRRLGEGAAGAVWLARDGRLEIDVAVKLLRAELATRSGVLESFTREADLSERMLSPNVVKVLGGGVSEGGLPYIVYEALEGEDLGSRLERDRRLPLPEAKTITVHVCRGLARAHAVGVLHRDIKPENLFLTTDSSGHLLAKVLDFGVAELIKKSDNDPDKMIGTLAYMAPEVFLGEKPPSPQSDLYAAGVVAYECMTGHLPRPGRSVAELVVALASGKVDPPSSRRFEISPELDAWFERALHRQPEGRFESAKEMAEALHVAMKSEQGPESRRATASLPAMRPRAMSFVFEEGVPQEHESERYSIIRPAEPESPRPPPTSLRRQSK